MSWELLHTDHADVLGVYVSREAALRDVQAMASRGDDVSCLAIAEIDRNGVARDTPIAIAQLGGGLLSV